MKTALACIPGWDEGWAKKGNRLKITTTSQYRERLNLSRWVVSLLGSKGVIRTAKGNRERFLQVMQHMSKALCGYSMYFFVDGTGWHKWEEVRLFVQRHTQIHLEYLPPYQPALVSRKIYGCKGNMRPRIMSGLIVWKTSISVLT